MKKILKTQLAILTFLGLLSDICNGQSIVAGIADTSDYYVDIIPNDTLLAQAAHFTPYTGGTIDLDVDGNGVSDFEFYAWGGGGLGGGGSSCRITPLSAMNKVLSHPETSVGYMGVLYTVNVPNPADFGDTLVPGLNTFKDTTSYLWSTTYGAAGFALVSSWNNIGDKYIGVLLDLGSDVLMGWIRVNVSYENTIYKLTIKDFACNKNPLISIPDRKAEAVKLYPNPVAQKVNVELPGSIRQAIVTVSDLNGKELFKYKAEHSRFQIDLDRLSNGFYLVKIVYDSGVVVKKIQRQEPAL